MSGIFGAKEGLRITPSRGGAYNNLPDYVWNQKEGLWEEAPSPDNLTPLLGGGISKTRHSKIRSSVSNIYGI